MMAPLPFQLLLLGSAAIALACPLPPDKPPEWPLGGAAQVSRPSCSLAFARSTRGTIPIILLVSVVLGQRCPDFCPTDVLLQILMSAGCPESPCAEIGLIDQPDPPEKLPTDFDCPQVRDLSWSGATSHHLICFCLYSCRPMT